MNTNEMIKSLEAQGYKVRKPTNREWWISFFNDGSHQIHDHMPDYPEGTATALLEIVHVLEKKMRKRRKKNEKQQTAEVGTA